RDPEVSGIPGDEDAAVAEAIRHQPPADPILATDHLVVEVVADPEDLADRPVAVDRVEIGRAWIELVVDQPTLAAVNGERRSAPPGIERIVRPGRRARKPLTLRRRADEGGLHELDDRRT